MIRYCIYIILLIALFSCNKPEAKLSADDTSSEDMLRSEIINHEAIDHETLDCKDLIVYVEDERNGLKLDKKIDELSYQLQYKPHDYIIALEHLDDSCIVSEKERLQRLEEINEMDYYTLRIRVDNYTDELIRYNLKSEEQYYKRLRYCMTEMQSDIYLLQGSDSLKCQLFHFERTFGIAPYLTFSLGFEKAKDSLRDCTFLFNDNLFNGGNIKMKISSEIFKNTPKLKTN